MTHDVSSWYWEQASKTSPPVTALNAFYIGSTDYSNFVSNWPNLKIDGSKVRPGTVNIELANQQGTFNFFVESKITLTDLCGIDIGFTSVTSHDPEYEGMYQGYIDNVIFDNHVIKLTLSDRIQRLTQRTIGTKDSPAVFSSTIMLASDIFWAICTSYGGLDTTASAANVDIDYTAWQAWAAVFSADSLIMGAAFKGVKCAEALSKLARMTHSTISTNGLKITPRRFTVNSENSYTFNETTSFKTKITLTDRTIINRQYMEALYIPNSNDWSIEVLSQNSASVNSFGLKEQREKDSAIWYTTSASALNYTQRIVSLNNEPNENLEIEAGFIAGLLHIGDIVTIDDVTQGLIGLPARIKTRDLNQKTGIVKLTAGTALLFNQFILDVTSLDGTETLV